MRRAVVICLLIVTLSLLCVGVISGTPLRHLVQVSAAVLALIALLRNAPWAPSAALPVFVFWLLIMALIWLYLLGLSTVAAGTYSGAEVALTAIIGAASLCGAVAALKSFRSGFVARAAAALLFAILQVAAMWLSLRPELARS